MNIKTTKFSQGLLTFTRNEVNIDFTCVRCNSAKKSKIVVKWKDTTGQEKTICNGCYGFLLSKEK
jgi:transcription elongation factor Elf1